MRHEVTTPFTPEQNGVSEHLNRTLQEMALSHIIHAGLPKHFWADSIAAAARSPTTGLTLIQLWGRLHGRQLSCRGVARILVWGV